MTLTKRLYGALLFLALALPVPMATAEDDTSRDEEKRDQQDQIRRKEITEDACDCCMKCQAARRETPGKESPRGEGNGCADCCDRCGTTRLPLEQTTPPEQKKE